MEGIWSSDQKGGGEAQQTELEICGFPIPSVVPLLQKHLKGKSPWANERSIWGFWSLSAARLNTSSLHYRASLRLHSRGGKKNKTCSLHASMSWLFFPTLCFCKSINAQGASLVSLCLFVWLILFSWRRVAQVHKLHQELALCEVATKRNNVHGNLLRCVNYLNLRMKHWGLICFNIQAC